jgi:two-component system CheB/CheR fusion protein
MSHFDERAPNDNIETLIRAIPTLSPAELRVCLLLLENHRTKEIAARLSLSERTIENHRLSIRRKMGARRELAIELMLLRGTEVGPSSTVPA